MEKTLLLGSLGKDWGGWRAGGEGQGNAWRDVGRQSDQRRPAFLFLLAPASHTRGADPRYPGRRP